MNTRKLVLSALFAALMAVCAWICVPLGNIRFTLQTFGVFLALLTLGGKWGTASIFVYLCLGAVGLPVFSGFHGGFGALFNATGGYLWGFLACGLVFWAITGIFPRQKWAIFAGIALGLGVCYGCGLGWMARVYLKGGSALSPGDLVLTCVVPYLLPDLGKIWLSFPLSKRLRKRL